MNRILILLASLLVGQAVWADSALENYFPRYAVLKKNHGGHLTIRVRLEDNNVALDAGHWQIGNYTYHLKGFVLLEDVRSLREAREKKINVRDNYVLEFTQPLIIKGTLRDFYLSIDEDAWVVRLLSKEEFQRYRDDRRNNVGQPFTSAQWLERQGKSTSPNPSPTPDSERQLLSTGTGFVVNKNFIATADHVLRMNDRGDVCNSVSIMYRHDEYQTTIADLDPTNDIGLLKLSKPISSTAKIRNDPDLRLGETAINYGFPLSGELSTSAKITSGAVNSLAGYNNNSAFIQYDAASQFGNSGGPVLDASGNVIGVVSAKLDDAENQLVNFATKSTILEGFLKANKVPFEKADLGEKLELPDIAEKAETFTVLVGCWE